MSDPKTDHLDLALIQDGDTNWGNKARDNYEKIDEGVKENSNNLSSHLSETASEEDDVHFLFSEGRIIEESDSNDNGEYIRYADGTQICILPHSKGVTLPCSVERGSLYRTGTEERYEWTFPAEFIERPTAYADTDTAGFIWGSISGLASGGSYARIELMSTDDRGEEEETIFACAIGRWK